MKLHPLSIPYRVLQSLVSLAWVLIVGFFVVPRAGDTALAAAVFGLGAIGLVLAVIVWQVAYYRRYEYELTEDTFDIDSGVLSRRAREIPYDRVQNVSIERNVIQRALGLAELRIETAGGTGSEAHLRFVGREEARRLQDELSERKRRHGETGAPREADATPDVAAGDATVEETHTGDVRDRGELLFEITPRELGVLGFVSLDTRLLPLLFFGLTPFIDTIAEYVAGSASTAVLVVPLLVAVVYVAMALVSAAYAVTNYYGFRLVRAGDELRYERGLLQRFSGTIPLSKVQALTVSENVLARLVGYASLSIETAGFSPGEAGGSQAAVPIAKRDRVTDLARRIEPVELGEFERPPSRARHRYLARYSGVVLLLAGIAFAGVSFDVWSGPWWAILGLLVLVPPAAHLKWRHLGYALTDDYVITRHGFWSRTTKIVPYHRVQTVADTQTIFQRRRRLATLRVDVAGSRSLVGDDSKAVDIDRAVAAELREEIGDRLLAALAEAGDRRRDSVPVDPGTTVERRSPGEDPSGVGAGSESG